MKNGRPSCGGSLVVDWQQSGSSGKREKKNIFYFLIEI